VVGNEVMGQSGDLHGASKTSECASDKHGDDDGAPRADASVAGSTLTLADRANLVTKACALDNEPVEHRHRQRDQDAGMYRVDRAWKAKDRALLWYQTGQLRACAYRWGGGDIHTLDLERASKGPFIADQIVDQQEGDGIEHDSGYHLMRPGQCLEHASDTCPDRASHSARN